VDRWAATAPVRPKASVISPAAALEQRGDEILVRTNREALAPRRPFTACHSPRHAGAHRVILQGTRGTGRFGQMRRALNTLVGRLAVLQLLIYAVLLPALFFGLYALARTNAFETFTRHARGYASSLARELELGDMLESPSRTIIFLDGSVEGGGCSYAAVEFNGRLFASSVTEMPAWVQSRGDDGHFGKSSDEIYAVAMPLRREGGVGTLYLGFDKRPTLEQLHAARGRIIEALVLYGIASIFATILLARLVSRPLTQLQTASRQVAQGDSATRLATDSTMVEIVGLSRDLENMRGELVGTAERLRTEMQQRQLEQAERARLENHLRHEQRLATIGTLAGGVAHEFNNILVPLILYTEEALEEIAAEHAARPNLDRVMKVATRASQVVSKLLAFSRPMVERQLEAVDLAAVTSEALDLSQSLMPPNIELKRDIGLRGEMVLGDVTLLNQVVLNLCSNAIQAMSERGGTLTVRIVPKDPADNGSRVPSRMLELRVKDTGIGMNPDIQERVFEPFFTTREVGQGSGLGLSIVHGIVTSMGGTISVASIPGQGTEFIVELPTIAARP
jgi:signal transduction histidine kinase